jgi:dihydroxy-acid dehydratase
MCQLDDAGGVQAVIKELSKKNLFDTSVMTVTGKTVAENIKTAFIRDENVIRPIENPFSDNGGIAILFGNLAPNGTVVKRSACAKELMHHTGPARVFNDESDAMDAVNKCQINPGDVVVIRYEGPKGGPGMREMLAPTSLLVGKGLGTKAALITDGSFSGGTRGICVGHICPEAAEGGVIALIEDGDIIEIDINKRSLELKVSDDVLVERRKKYTPQIPKITSGYLSKYARTVQDASHGAIV